MLYLVIRVAYKQEPMYHLTIKKLTGDWLQKSSQEKSILVRFKDSNEFELWS